MRARLRMRSPAEPAASSDSSPRESYQPLPPPPPPPPPELPPGVEAAAIVSPSEETEFVKLPIEKPELPESRYHGDTACASAAPPSAMTKRSAQVFSTSSATA